MWFFKQKPLDLTIEALKKTLKKNQLILEDRQGAWELCRRADPLLFVLLEEASMAQQSTLVWDVHVGL